MSANRETSNHKIQYQPPLIISSTQEQEDNGNSTTYPLWLDDLFLRFIAVYQGRWAYAIQEPRMLEVIKSEWFEALKEFNHEIIMETVSDYVKKIPGDFPSLQKFYEVAASKARARKAAEDMEREGQERAKSLKHKIDPQLAIKAREEIKKLFDKKIINRPRNSRTRGLV